MTDIIIREAKESDLLTIGKSLIQCKMSLKVRVMLLIFYQIIYPFPTVLF